MAWERRKLHPVVGCCEHGNEPSDSKNYDDFPEQLNDYQLLRKDAAICSS